MVDNEVYPLCESFGGFGFVNAIPCDFDNDGNKDLFVASSWGSGLHRSVISVLMSRGTREVARLIHAMGGNELSAYGLCHLGDYEATVFSPFSHNRRFGQYFVEGKPFDKLAEGYYTVEALLDLGHRYGVELPICEAVHAALYEGVDPRAAIQNLMNRDLKGEWD